MKKLLLIFLALTSANIFAELNKWTDENGKVHYSDQPPPAHIKAKVLRSTPVADSFATASGVAASSAPGAPKTIAETEAEFKKAQLAKKQAAEKIAQEQAKAEATKAQCAVLQQSILTLGSGVRIPVFANGERVYMSDQQRQQDLAKAQQEFSAHCN